MNAPWKAGSSTREAFVAYACDETTAEAIRPIAVELGWSDDKINKGGLRNAVQSLSVSASPHILFVDLSESGDPLNDINALAEVCEPGTVVIAAGQVNDVRLYRDLLASGIQDYLLKPLSPDMLREAFAHAQAILSAPKVDTGTERPHISTAVIGTRGGVGASTLATSLAWLFSERDQRNTALLDLDVHFGTGALALDVEPGRGLTDAIENPSRIDGLFIERAMVKATERLSILSAEAPIHQPVISDGSAFFQLQEEMRGAFECTVIDMPRSILVQHPHLINDAQVAVIVTEITLAVVGNRVPASGALEINRKDFEGSIERKIDYCVPFDQKLAANAAKLGKPLAEAGKGSKTIQPLLQLAERILGAAEEQAEAAVESGKAKAKGASKGMSLLGKFGDLKAMMPKKAK